VNSVRSKDGTSIVFDRAGTGPALILVGGAFQHRAIDPRRTHLAEHFTVFHYDRGGRGESTDTQPYAVDREIEDLEALLSEAGGSALMFGMSSGGNLALDAARRLGSTRLVVYVPALVVDDSRPLLWNDFEAVAHTLVYDASITADTLTGSPEHDVAPEVLAPLTVEFFAATVKA
jgi:alpha-beta hydrolase superfamily lysophospholipase